jgi:hypothetical protein
LLRLAPSGICFCIHPEPGLYLLPKDTSSVFTLFFMTHEHWMRSWESASCEIYSMMKEFLLFGFRVQHGHLFR